MPDHCETYERDGVTYDITVKRQGTGYLGSWYCRTCCELGSSSHIDSSIQNAVRGAIANTGGHHWSRHSKSDGA